MIPVAFLVTMGVFVLVRISPGDPALPFAGEERDPAAIAAIREKMGLNQPLPVQYVVWLGHLAQGDLGRSFQTHQRVLEAVTERLPATLELGLAALFFSVTVALIVGILSAVKRNSIVDLLATSITLAGVSFQGFFLGIVLILLFAYLIPGHIFPPGGYVPLTQDVGDNLRRLAVPAIPSGDYPVVQGVVLVSAFSYMFTTLLVDVLYAWIDPRISFETASA